MVVDKAAACLGMGIGIGHIGLDIENGRSIHQVGSTHMQHRSLWALPFHALQLHRRQPQRIGTEGAARSKHAHTLIATQTRRAHHGAVGSVLVGMESPNEPQKIKRVDATQRIGIAIGGHEHNRSAQRFNNAALFGHAKLCGKGRMEMGYGLEGHGR